MKIGIRGGCAGAGAATTTGAAIISMGLESTRVRWAMSKLRSPFSSVPSLDKWFSSLSWSVCGRMFLISFASGCSAGSDASIVFSLSLGIAGKIDDSSAFCLPSTITVSQGSSSISSVGDDAPDESDELSIAMLVTVDLSFGTDRSQEAKTEDDDVSIGSS